MSRRPLFILVSVLIAAAALSAWIAGRPRLALFQKTAVEKIAVALGCPVKIDGVAFGWRSGLVVALRAPRVYASESAAGPFFSADRIDLRISPGSFLRARVEISDLSVMKPDLLLEKDERGNFGPAGLRTAAGRPGFGQGWGAATVRRVLLRNGTLRIRERSRPAEWVFSRLDAEISEVAFPFRARFEFKAASPGSGSGNIEASGEIFTAGEPARLNARLSGTFVLDPVKFGKVPGLSSMAGVAGAGGEFKAGRVSGSLKEILYAADGSFSGISGVFDLEIEEFKNSRGTLPLSRLRAEILAEGDAFRIEGGRAALGKGTLDFTGSVSRVFSPAPVVKATAALRSAELAELIPPAAGRAGPPAGRRIRGVVNADLEIGFSGFGGESFRRSAAGGGRFEVTEGAVENFNVLAILLQKVSASQLAGFDLRPYLHPAYQALLASPEMRIRLAQGKFSIGGGNVELSEVNVYSDECMAYGRGHVSMGGRARLGCVLAVAPSFSAELIRLIPDFIALSDPYGSLAFPFSVAGRVTEPMVTVDKDYLVNRVVAYKGSQFISNVLNQGSDAAGNAGSQASDVLKNIF